MITKTPIAGMTKEDWLAERAKSIGGSEIGAILGLNQFQSAYSLWAQRTGRTAPFEGNLQTEFGTYMEEFVAQMFSKRSGLAVRRTNYIYRNDKYPTLHASPDRLIQGMGAGLECKTTSAWNATKFHGEDFPGQYYAQSVQYMAVLEVAVWYIAVLIGNQDFKIYMLTRDDSLPKPEWCDGRLVVEDGEIEALNGAAEAFMDCLRRDVPPEMDGSAATTEALKTIYAESRPGTVDLFGREGQLDEYLELDAQIKQLSDRQESIKNVLKADLGEMDTGLCGKHKVTWKLQERTTLDSKALKKDLPDVAARYSKSSVARVFKIA